MTVTKTTAELSEMLRRVHRDAGVAFEPETEETFLRTVAGLSEFAAEHALVRSMSTEGLDLDKLLEHVRDLVDTNK